MCREAIPNATTPAERPFANFRARRLPAALLLLVGIAAAAIPARAQETCPVPDDKKAQAAEEIPGLKRDIDEQEVAVVQQRQKVDYLEDVTKRSRIDADSAEKKIEDARADFFKKNPNADVDDFKKTAEYKQLRHEKFEADWKYQEKASELERERRKLNQAKANLEADKDYLWYLEEIASGRLKLLDPRCRKPPHRPSKKTTGPKKPKPFLRPKQADILPTYPSSLPFPVVIEAMAWGGGLSASSFGTNYDTGFWGGRVAARVAAGEFRLQGDIQGERTNDYSTLVGYRGYVSGGLHLDYAFTPAAEIGVFGGLQDAKATFHGPASTNYFVGLEARYFAGPAVFGAQFGRFDVASGPGTLTDAWFAEGRVRFRLSQIGLNYTTIGGEFGYGSGTLAGFNRSAETTYWGVRATQQIPDTPLSLFVAYEHFENRVSGLGQVWREDLLKGGLKITLPGTDTRLQSIEPTEPLPFLLRTVMTF